MVPPELSPQNISRSPRLFHGQSLLGQLSQFSAFVSPSKLKQIQPMSARNWKQRLTISSVGVLIGLIGAAATVQNTAQAIPAPSEIHLAQSLPPLPPVDGGNNLPPVGVPSSGTSSVPGTVSQRYMVYVNGNSPLLLDQVRLVQPDAFRQQYNGRTVIQAGLYNSEQNAREQVQQLANYGIGADITSVQRAVPAANSFASVPSPPSYSATNGSSVPISVVPVPDNSVEFGQAPNSTLPPPPGATASGIPPAGGAPSSAYYVVIPSGQQTMATLRNQIVDLGISPNLVQTRTAPHGPHVAVGPFSNRSDAEEWNRFLTGFGMDARVHFQR